jgi:hypothetical protein
MLTILVFEIKDGKNAQKVKKNINCNLSLLIRGIIPRKFETRKCYFLHSEHPKNKKIINNNLSLLSGRKTGGGICPNSLRVKSWVKSWVIKCAKNAFFH